MAASGRIEARGNDPVARVSGELAQCLPPGAAVLVAFSGGRDSTVLLHGLAGLRASRGFKLRAAHVNHGLNPGSGTWAEHCRAIAGRLDVPCLDLAVDVHDEAGHGIEAAARHARYAALSAQMKPGEWLVTGHHADDQLETMLLHLFRGSGVAGLAGIPASTVFGVGHLARPLLGLAGRDLRDYAEKILQPAGIAWLSDPMNADPARDRNFIRHHVAPLLAGRFPAVVAAAGRTAGLAAEGAGLLDDLASQDAGQVQDPCDGSRLDLAGLRSLSPARQRNLIRFLARRRGWAVPPERRLRTGLASLLDAASGRQPVLRWAGHEIRRYRDHVYLLDAGIEKGNPETLLAWSGLAPLELGGGRGRLELKPGSATDLALRARCLDARLKASGFSVGFRDGGERLRPAGDRHHRSLKYLFQSRGIVPWMRPRIPLISAGGRLAAVGDLWIASWAAADATHEALEIVWQGHASLQ
ncbi:MAG: tRNA lysidine(34) synthetase TilS [Gammaproteobacteria bacterium PRO9]|nr:tRNA lysidine(34) synthetase TilS [Gammaproteobacteria bacterium PRO9]